MRLSETHPSRVLSAPGATPDALGRALQTPAAGGADTLLTFRRLTQRARDEIAGAIHGGQDTTGTRELLRRYDLLLALVPAPSSTGASAVPVAPTADMLPMLDQVANLSDVSAEHVEMSQLLQADEITFPQYRSYALLLSDLAARTGALAAQLRGEADTSSPRGPSDVLGVAVPLRTRQPSGRVVHPPRVRSTTEVLRELALERRTARGFPFPEIKEALRPLGLECTGRHASGSESLILELAGDRVLKVALSIGDRGDVGRRPFDPPGREEGETEIHLEGRPPVTVRWAVVPRVTMDVTLLEGIELAQRIDALGYEFPDAGLVPHQQAGRYEGKVYLVDENAAERPGQHLGERQRDAQGRAFEALRAARTPQENAIDHILNGPGEGSDLSDIVDLLRPYLTRFIGREGKDVFFVELLPAVKAKLGETSEAYRHMFQLLEEARYLPAAERAPFLSRMARESSDWL